MVLNRVIKPKNQRVKRVLEKRESLLHENDKTAIFVKGGRTSKTITEVLKELAMMKKPLSTMFQKKNITRPFDDPTSIEFFAKKSDSSLFMFGSDSKKRPDNLIIGRLFDHQILDMFEFGVKKFRSLQDFHTSKIPLGTKPCLLFAGEAFIMNDEYRILKNLLIDFFRGPKVSQLRLSGVEHVYLFTAREGQLHIRSYRILLKKSGQRTPRIELDEIGPSLDLVMRRRKLASDDLFALARKQPKAAKVKKVKNVEQDPFGSKVGQLHMPSQDLDKIQLRKMKGLKKKKSDSKNDSVAEDGSGDEKTKGLKRKKSPSKNDSMADEDDTSAEAAIPAKKKKNRTDE